MNGAQSKTVMAKLSWHPLGSLDIDLSPRWNKTSTNCCVLVLTSFNPIQGALLSNIAQLPAGTLLAGITPGPDNRDVRNDAFTGQDSTDKGVGLRVNWAMPSGASLTSITSASRYDANDNRDQDFVDVHTLLYYPLANGRAAGVDAGYIQYGTFKVTSQPQELRYVSPDASALRYVAGLWYGKNTIRPRGISCRIGARSSGCATTTRRRAITSRSGRRRPATSRRRDHSRAPATARTRSPARRACSIRSLATSWSTR